MQGKITRILCDDAGTFKAEETLKRDFKNAKMCSKNII